MLSGLHCEEYHHQVGGLSDLTAFMDTLTLLPMCSPSFLFKVQGLGFFNVWFYAGELEVFGMPCMYASFSEFHPNISVNM